MCVELSHDENCRVTDFPSAAMADNKKSSSYKLNTVRTTPSSWNNEPLIRYFFFETWSQWLLKLRNFKLIFFYSSSLQNARNYSDNDPSDSLSLSLSPLPLLSDMKEFLKLEKVSRCVWIILCMRGRKVSTIWIFSSLRPCWKMQKLFRFNNKKIVLNPLNLHFLLLSLFAALRF